MKLTVLNPQPKHKPWRSKKYRLFVASLPCCMCGSNYAVVAHHPKTGGMSTKCGDELCVSACFFCHDGMDSKRKDDIPDLEGKIKRTQELWIQRGGKAEWKGECFMGFFLE